MDPSPSVVPQIKEKIVKAIALCVVVFIMIVSIVIAVIITVARNRTSPYIEDLYIPSLTLNKTTFNSSVFVDLKFKRAAALTRHGFPDFQMRLSYGPYRSKSSHVGEQEVQGFIMGRQKRVDVKVAVEAKEMPWEEASRISSGKVVKMVVELMMSEDTSWVARVAVDASGHMVSKKPIKFEEWYLLCLG